MRFSLPRHAAVLVATLGVAAATWGAGAQTNGRQPFGHLIASSDSLDFRGATLSPDGKWIAFNGVSLIPAAGGKVTHLTPPQVRGARPVWFPSSDQIAFTEPTGIMRLSIDRRSGQPVGATKRVTVEVSAQGFDISPDGRKIVYRTATEPSGRAQLKIVPSTGGNARVLVELAHGGQVWNPVFSKDGRYVYYIKADTVMRVPTAGGEAVHVFGPAGPINLFEPHREVALLRKEQNMAALVTLAGDTIAAIPLTKGIEARSRSVMRFAPDGRAILAHETRDTTSLALVSASASGTRLVTAPGHEWPMFWLSDGTQLISGPSRNTDSGVVMINVKTGKTTMLAANGSAENLPGFTAPGTRNFAASADGRTLMYTLVEKGQPNRLFLLDVATHAAREVARGQYLRGLWYTGNVGGAREFTYVLPAGNEVELHGLTPDGKTRLIARTPHARDFWAVRGDQVAYAIQTVDSTTVFTVRGASEPPARLISFAGRAASPDAFAWSPDGRTLALITHSGTKQDAMYRVIFVDVGGNGQAHVPPRSVTIEDGWHLTWLPDGSGVVFFGMDPTGTVTNVWRVSKAADGPPISLTRGVKDPFWEYALSPDGRTLALPLEHSTGSAIWRIDLDSAAAAYARSARSGTR